MFKIISYNLSSLERFDGLKSLQQVRTILEEVSNLDPDTYIYLITINQDRMKGNKLYFIFEVLHLLLFWKDQINSNIDQYVLNSIKKNINKLLTKNDDRVAFNDYLERISFKNIMKVDLIHTFRSNEIDFSPSLMDLDFLINEIPNHKIDEFNTQRQLFDQFYNGILLDFKDDYLAIDVNKYSADIHQMYIKNKIEFLTSQSLFKYQEISKFSDFNRTQYQFKAFVDMFDNSLVMQNKLNEIFLDSTNDESFTFDYQNLVESLKTLSDNQSLYNSFNNLLCCFLLPGVQFDQDDINDFFMSPLDKRHYCLRNIGSQGWVVHEMSVVELVAIMVNINEIDDMFKSRIIDYFQSQLNSVAIQRSTINFLDGSYKMEWRFFSAINTLLDHNLLSPEKALLLFKDHLAYYHSFIPTPKFFKGVVDIDKHIKLAKKEVKHISEFFRKISVFKPLVQMEKKWFITQFDSFIYYSNIFLNNIFSENKNMKIVNYLLSLIKIFELSLTELIRSPSKINPLTKDDFHNDTVALFKEIDKKLIMQSLNSTKSFLKKELKDKQYDTLTIVLDTWYSLIYDEINKKYPLNGLSEVQLNDLNHIVIGMVIANFSLLYFSEEPNHQRSIFQQLLYPWCLEKTSNATISMTFLHSFFEEYRVLFCSFNLEGMYKALDIIMIRLLDAATSKLFEFFAAIRHIDLPNQAFNPEKLKLQFYGISFLRPIYFQSGLEEVQAFNMETFDLMVEDDWFLIQQITLIDQRTDPVYIKNSQKWYQFKEPIPNDFANLCLSIGLVGNRLNKLISILSQNLKNEFNERATSGLHISSTNLIAVFDGYIQLMNNLASYLISEFFDGNFFDALVNLKRTNPQQSKFILQSLITFTATEHTPLVFRIALFPLIVEILNKNLIPIIDNKSKPLKKDSFKYSGSIFQSDLTNIVNNYFKPSLFDSFFQIKIIDDYQETIINSLESVRSVKIWKSINDNIQQIIESDFLKSGRESIAYKLKQSESYANSLSLDSQGDLNLERAKKNKSKKHKKKISSNAKSDSCQIIDEVKSAEELIEKDHLISNPLINDSLSTVSFDPIMLIRATIDQLDFEPVKLKKKVKDGPNNDHNFSIYQHCVEELDKNGYFQMLNEAGIKVSLLESIHSKKDIIDSLNFLLNPFDHEKMSSLTVDKYGVDSKNELSVVNTDNNTIKKISDLISDIDTYKKLYLHWVTSGLFHKLSLDQTTIHEITECYSHLCNDSLSDDERFQNAKRFDEFIHLIQSSV